MDKDPNESAGGDTFSDQLDAKVYAMVMAYTTREGIKLDNRQGGWKRKDAVDATYSSEEIADLVWAKHPDIPTKLFRIVTQEIARRLRNEAHTRIVKKLTAVGERRPAETELCRFISLIQREDIAEQGLHDRYSYYIIAFRQLMWQVKRRLAKKLTKTDAMLVLVGGQGTGKSTAIRMFCEPLDFLCLPDGDFSMFADGFRGTVFQRYYLVILDEMQQASKTDVEAIKRKLSTTYLQGRKMRSQEEVGYERNASFLGATNLDLLSHIQDPTGMRRFAEIRFRTTKVTSKWLAAMRAINYDLIWSLEDANEETAPFDRHKDLVREFQAETVVASSFEGWEKDCLMPSSDQEDTVQFKDAWSSYVGWCDYYKVRHAGRNAFAKYMDEKCCWYLPRNKKTYKGLALSNTAVNGAGVV